MNWNIDKYKAEHESDDEWILRRTFIENLKWNYPKEKLLKLSCVYTNIKFRRHTYPKEVMKEVALMAEEVNNCLTYTRSVRNSSYRNSYYSGDNESSWRKDIQKHTNTSLVDHSTKFTQEKYVDHPSQENITQKEDGLKTCIKANKPISQDDSVLLQNEILKSISSYDEGIKFLRCSAEADCFIVTCANEQSRDWLDKQIPTLEPWDGAQLTIVNENVLPTTETGKKRPWLPENNLDPNNLIDRLMNSQSIETLTYDAIRNISTTSPFDPSTSKSSTDFLKLQLQNAANSNESMRPKRMKNSTKDASDGHLYSIKAASLDVSKNIPSIVEPKNKVTSLKAPSCYLKAVIETPISDRTVASNLSYSYSRSEPHTRTKSGSHTLVTPLLAALDPGANLSDLKESTKPSIDANSIVSQDNHNLVTQLSVDLISISNTINIETNQITKKELANGQLSSNVGTTVSLIVPNKEGMRRRSKPRGKRAGKLAKAQAARSKTNANIQTDQPEDSKPNSETKNTSATEFKTNKLCVAIMAEPFNALTEKQAKEIQTALELKLENELLSPETTVITSRVRFRGKAHYHSGVLRLWCETEFSLAWLRRSVDTLLSPVPNTKLVVKPQSALQRKILCGLFVPEINRDVGTLHELLAAQNQFVNVNTWSLMKAENQMERKLPGVYLLFHVPLIDVETLKKEDRRLFWLMGNIYVRILEQAKESIHQSITLV